MSIFYWTVLKSLIIFCLSCSLLARPRALVLLFITAISTSRSTYAIPEAPSSETFFLETSSSCLLLLSNSLAYFWNLPISPCRSFICFLEAMYAVFYLSQTSRQFLSSAVKSCILVSYWPICPSWALINSSFSAITPSRFRHSLFST